MNVQINKASLKDGLFLKGDYDEAMKDASRNIKFDDSNPVHPDLSAVFEHLAEHLRVLCQQPTDRITVDEEPSEKEYVCTGFSIGSNDSGVTLIGYRVLDGRRILNLVSPFYKWEADDWQYKQASELGELIERGKDEVRAYLFDGKHAPNPQLEIAFPEEGEEEVTVIVGGQDAKKRRNNKKKVDAGGEEEQTF